MTSGRSPDADSTCPSCSEPVGIRASYCMHCGRDLPDRVEYDDVTGGADVTDGTDVTGGTDDGSEALLTRLRPGDTDDGDESVTGTTDTIEWADESGDAEVTRSGPAVPSGRGSDGPTFLHTDGAFDRPRSAGRFLGALGLLGAVGVVGLGLPVAVAGAVLALTAWAGSVVSLALRRTGFDAMRYGSSGLMVTLIFVSFTLAFGGDGSGPLPAAFALVPIGLAALFVAGLGRTTPTDVPE